MATRGTGGGQQSKDKVALLDKASGIVQTLLSTFSAGAQQTTPGWGLSKSLLPGQSPPVPHPTPSLVPLLWKWAPHRLLRRREGPGEASGR